jgi:DNA-binding beta-propeller fold protein YncE
MSIRTLALVGLGISYAFSGVARAEQVFWPDRTNLTIAFANRDGTSPGSFPAGSDPQAIAVDTLNGHVYWSDNQTPKFRRSNLDGTGAIDILPPVGSTIEFRTIAMEVDPIGGKLYWLNTIGGVKLLRANFDGTGIETLFDITTPFMVVLGFALDLPNNAVYLPDAVTGSLRRVGLDGSNLTTILTVAGNSMSEVVLDAVGGRLYWVGCQGAVQSSDLSGGDIQTIVPADATRCRVGLALDPAIGKLYFSSEEGFVSRVNTDGTGLELIDGTGNTIEKVAIDTPPLDPSATPAASTWGLIVMATLLATFGTMTIQRRTAIA